MKHSEIQFKNNSQDDKIYLNGTFIDLNGMTVQEYMNASKPIGGTSGESCECIEVSYEDEELNNAEN
jgi:hypothetical protein